MERLTRSQVLVYAAVGIALLLLGVRWLRSGEESTPAGSVSFANEAASAGAGSGGSGQDVVVHVAGAVRKPGVFRLPAGSRVTDAVERAGGARPGAAMAGINLAARLGDGQQVVVPTAGGADTAPGGGDGPISVGTATAADLEEIEGIGPVTAQKIVEFRDQRGGLSSVEELDEISGIGPATMEDLRAGLQP